MKNNINQYHKRVDLNSEEEIVGDQYQKYDLFITL
jgi:hypothetical protein